MTRYRAHSTRVGAESLLNVVETGPSATDRRFVFVRVRPTAGGGLSMAVVQEDAVKGKVAATAILEITKRVADPTLDGPFATCTATGARP